MKRPPLTDEQKARILEIFQETQSTPTTARLVGCSQHQVDKYLTKQGVARTRLRDNAILRNADTVRRLAAEGASLSEIARQVGTNKRHVKAYLERHAVPYTPYEPVMERNGRWRGGRVIDQDGYVLIKCPDHPARDRHNYVREHRLVMEQTLGRYLQPQEVVHHKNGDKQDNRPENLAVYGTNADHLAETLKGQRPQWTAEGWERMRAPRRRRASRADNTTPQT